MDETTNESDTLEELPSSESDEGNIESKLDGSKPVCFIGKLKNDKCSYWSGRGKRLPPAMYKNCMEDIEIHLSSVISHTTVALCPNSNEQWLIKNRIGTEIADDAFLCGKHRSKYGIGFQDNTCSYPGHVTEAKKRKGRTDLRIILAENLKAIKIMHSSQLNIVHLPIGSVWCTTCRSRQHPPTMETYNDDETVCLVCCEVHSSTIGTETPQKRQQLSAENVDPQFPDNVEGTPCSQMSFDSQDSQDEFTPEEIQRDTFNKSMSDMNATWTPLKYQLRKDISVLNHKTKDTIVRKAIRAVDSVLEEIAPGQGHILKEEICKKNTIVDVSKQIKEAVEMAAGNVRIQLLSLVAGKNEEGHYNFTISEMMKMFPTVSKHYVEMARNHAVAGKTGIPIVPGKYTRKRLKDSQINHFLDFLQYSNLVQDVASGTRNVTLSTRRKVTMPNVVRTVHKAEMIRLYEAACDKEGYHEDIPSTRTLWNIIEMCPASQRKSLAGLDNVAAEGSDSFDVLSQVLKKIILNHPNRKEEMEELERALMKGKRYLKGEYKSNCKNTSSEIADHCRTFALSDPKEKEFQKTCDHQHVKQCNDCEEMKKVLDRFRKLDLDGFDTKVTGVLQYDIKDACSKIEIWKTHILTVIHQDSHKYDVLSTLDEKTGMIIIDFAMKFLSRRYRESMAKWFGKSGNGMHVMCVIYKVAQKFRKRTYICFIGKSSQDVGSVMTIYQSCLEQIRVDLPQIVKLIDKSDNAGCYHTETLFTWKALWTKNTGHEFIETMFNERQAGKDQCDRDSATAKRQMNYYLNSGHNVENAEEMNDALRTATAICGFSSCVMEIKKGECANPENIKNISKIHHIKYTNTGEQPMFHVWQYYGIGTGKKYPVGALPETPEYTVTVPFESDHLFGTVMIKEKQKDETIFCAEAMCKKSFDSVDNMLHHFDYEEHDYVDSKTVTQLSTVADKWVQRFAVEEATESASCSKALVSEVCGTSLSKLAMGWAIPKRSQRRLTNVQKNFLNKLFDEGERTGAKVSAEHTLKTMKEEFDPVHFLPLSSIKSYFSRRAKSIREGKSKIGELFPVIEATQTHKNQVDDHQENRDSLLSEEEEEEEEEDPNKDNDNDEEQRTKAVSRIMSMSEFTPNLQPDDWIAVDMGSTWYPGQFVKFDSELEELQVNFLHRSSSNVKWFVWPLFQVNGEEDKSWVKEESVFYRLSEPKEGRRETLIFDNYADVEKAFKDIHC